MSHDLSPRIRFNSGSSLHTFISAKTGINVINDYGISVTANGDDTTKALYISTQEAKANLHIIAEAPFFARVQFLRALGAPFAFFRAIFLDEHSFSEDDWKWLSFGLPVSPEKCVKFAENATQKLRAANISRDERNRATAVVSTLAESLTEKGGVIELKDDFNLPLSTCQEIIRAIHEEELADRVRWQVGENLFFTQDGSLFTQIAPEVTAEIRTNVLNKFKENKNTKNIPEDTVRGWLYTLAGGKVLTLKMSECDSINSDNTRDIYTNFFSCGFAGRVRILNLEGRMVDWPPDPNQSNNP
ncbi:MAG: hypothetical protein LBB14_03000 [Puniceicoccales bacterium]|jgi:hypothetical protein|nr:hypothetical protein [Puniceicoccales bacterium]